MYLPAIGGAAVVGDHMALVIRGRHGRRHRLLPLSTGPASRSGARSRGIPSVRFRTLPSALCYAEIMTTIRAEDVRIPRHAREAVARHELVVVANRERPVFV